MKSKAIADRAPTVPQHARGVDGLPSRLLVLAAMVATWWWIIGQPAKVSAELVHVGLLMAMGAMAAKVASELVAGLRGKDGMEVLATLGHWTATVFASLVYVGLMGVVLTLVCYWTGLTGLGLLRFFGLNV